MRPAAHPPIQDRLAWDDMVCGRQSLSVMPKMVERRAQPRRPAKGEIKLRPEGCAGMITGRLVDVTSSGFRAVHGFQPLASGNLVEFEYGSAKGRARVIWTQIVGDNVESGFFILADLKP